MLNVHTIARHCFEASNTNGILTNRSPFVALLGIRPPGAFVVNRKNGHSVPDKAGKLSKSLSRRTRPMELVLVLSSLLVNMIWKVVSCLGKQQSAF